MTIQEMQDLGVFPKGELPDPLAVTFRDAAGVVIDLSIGFTAKAAITHIEGTATGLAAGTLSAPDATGVIAYTWALADFAVEGSYRIQIWVDRPATVRYASKVFYYAVEEATSVPTF